MGPRWRKLEKNLEIKVAQGQPLHTHASLVRGLCDSADGLPAAAAVWDVSGLLLDGQPFSRETVSCWLSCARNFLHDCGNSAQHITHQLSTVKGLAQMLAFADAVWSCVGLCKALCSQLQQLKFAVQLPEQALELPVAGYTYGWSPENDRQLLQCSVHKRARVGDPVTSLEQQRDVQQQVATQTSALLRLAHALRLRPLLGVLHQFLLLNARPPSSACLLSGAAGLVFRDAVLEAALGGSTLGKEAYISSVMSQPCSLTPDRLGYSSLLKPVGPRSYDTEKDLLEFDAQLLRDFAGGEVGDTVRVKLDLFGATGYPGGVVELEPVAESSTCVVLPVQLLVGRTFDNAAALTAFLSTDAAADR